MVNYETMAKQEDTPKIAKRRIREARTVSQMICIHCRDNHPKETLTETAHCGEQCCPECKALDDYAVLRTQRCRQMGTKTSCEECPYHCYKPEMREKVRAVMRYSGPRMMKYHPVAAVRHLLGK